MLIFEVRASQREPRRCRLPERDVAIGRDAANDIVLSDGNASRFHAAIIMKGGGEYVLRDLGSRNGTKVNGKECFRHVLEPNDEIRIGSDAVTFLGQSSQEEEAARPRFVIPRKPSRSAKAPATTDTVWDSQTLPTPANPLSLGGLSFDNEQLLHTLKCAQVITSTRSVPQMLARLLESVRVTLGGERGFTVLCDGERLACDAVSPAMPPDAEFTLSNPDGVYQALENRAPVLCAASRTDANDVIYIPLLVGSVTIGVVGIEGRYDGQTSVEGLNVATALCGLCAQHIDNAREFARLKQQCIRLHETVQAKNRFVGSSPVLHKVYATINQAAQCSLPLLITGETGTGKELVARAVHELSRRSGATYLCCNCAAAVENLLESEMFGYAPMSGIANANPKGKPGKFELAHEGTIFLDEVGDFPLGMQAKLLRVLEDSMVDRIGAEKPTPVDVRVIAATNRDLKTMVAEGKFREDLYFRLNCLQVTLPPLRERVSDILLLAAYFLEHPAPGLQSNDGIRITKEVARFLLSNRLPGNVRQLRNGIWSAASLATRGEMEIEDFPPDLLDPTMSGKTVKSLRRIEKEHIQRALEAAEGNKRKAALMLGISPQTLYSKLKEFGISASDDTADD